MPQKSKVLPELEISQFTARCTDQRTVDTALRIIYEKKPDIFYRISEKDRKRLHLGEDGNDFYRLIRDEVWNHIQKPEPGNVAEISAAILLEAKRRARLMYSIVLESESDAGPHTNGNNK
jgi:hypothetical protein